MKINCKITYFEHKVLVQVALKFFRLVVAEIVPKKERLALQQLKTATFFFLFL